MLATKCPPLETVSVPLALPAFPGVVTEGDPRTGRNRDEVDELLVVGLEFPDKLLALADDVIE
jgi:hypothetical protein